MVLIIADEPVACEVYGELFAMRGHDVATAGSAREGLRLARDRRIGIVILAMTSGASPLRRQILAMRPLVRVHMIGQFPLPFDVMSQLARQQLH